IRMAIVIEVGYREVVRLGTGVEGRARRRMKPAAPIVEQNGDGTVLEIGDDEVGAGIVVEVGGRYHGSVRTGRKAGLMERQIATGECREQNDHEWLHAGKDGSLRASVNACAAPEDHLHRGAF